MSDHYVRWGRNDGIGGATEESFDTAQEADDFADAIREELSDACYVAVQHCLSSQEFDFFERAWKPLCVQCKAATDAIFHRESGGLCGNCLADHALPLTQVGLADKMKRFEAELARHGECIR